MTNEYLGQTTSAVRKGHAIDTSALRNYLNENIENFNGGNLNGKLELRQFNVGQSNPTYLLEAEGGRKYVVRKQPPGSRSNKTAHQVDREYYIMKAMANYDGVPVPKVHCLCKDASILGGEFFVMDFVPGRIFGSPALHGLSPTERRECYADLLRVLSNLHKAPWRKLGLHDFGRCGNYYERQFSSLTYVSERQEKVSDSVPKLDAETLADELKVYSPDDEVSIVHGDFKFALSFKFLYDDILRMRYEEKNIRLSYSRVIWSDNFIFHPTQPRIIAVLDWELSTIGHPMSDVSNLFCVTYETPYSTLELVKKGIFGGLAGYPGELSKDGIPEPDELLQTYSELMNRKYPDPNWPFYKAFYYWRGAIICQGIAARVASGQASNPDAKRYANSTLGLKHMAVNNLDILKEHLTPQKPITVLGNIFPRDDYCHRAPKDVSNYNESVYLNFHDIPSSGAPVGGFVRLGNRVNEGQAEMTICVYHPNGNDVFFTYKKPKIVTNNGWNAGGLQVDIRNALRKIDVIYSGGVMSMKKPMQMLRPKEVYKSVKEGQGFTTREEIELKLSYQACGPIWGGSIDNYWATLSKEELEKAKAKDKNNFARNHYEQHMQVSGELKVNGKIYTINGNGVRDHSWGPRFWQETKSYRFITGNFGDELGIACSLVGESGYHGIIQLGTSKADLVQKITLETAYSSPDDGIWWKALERPKSVLRRHHRMRFIVETADGSIEIEAQVVNFMPLRNRRNGEHTYIGEGLTHYRVNSASSCYAEYIGKTGYGMSEYLDQGLPEVGPDAKL